MSTNSPTSSGFDLDAYLDLSSDVTLDSTFSSNLPLTSSLSPLPHSDPSPNPSTSSASPPKPTPSPDMSGLELGREIQRGLSPAPQFQPPSHDYNMFTQQTFAFDGFGGEFDMDLGDEFGGGGFGGGSSIGGMGAGMGVGMGSGMGGSTMGGSTTGTVGSVQQQPFYFTDPGAGDGFGKDTGMSGMGALGGITPIMTSTRSEISTGGSGLSSHQQQHFNRQAESQRKLVYAGYHREQEALKQQQQSALLRQQQQQQQAAQHQQTFSMPQLDPKVEGVLASLRVERIDRPLPPNMPHIDKLKKDEDQMDDDERLLASEEGKKLSSKERRQLRNKVSARAFRSRRKEYITQLEQEVNKKSLEAHGYSVEIERLRLENARLEALSRNLLRHPEVSKLVDLEEILAAFPAQTAQQGSNSSLQVPRSSTNNPASGRDGGYPANRNSLILEGGEFDGTGQTNLAPRPIQQQVARHQMPTPPTSRENSSLSTSISESTLEESYSSSLPQQQLLQPRMKFEIRSNNGVPGAMGYAGMGVGGHLQGQGGHLRTHSSESEPPLLGMVGHGKIQAF